MMNKKEIKKPGVIKQILICKYEFFTCEQDTYIVFRSSGQLSLSWPPPLSLPLFLLLSRRFLCLLMADFVRILGGSAQLRADAAHSWQNSALSPTPSAPPPFASTHPPPDFTPPSFINSVIAFGRLSALFASVVTGGVFIFCPVCPANRNRSLNKPANLLWREKIPCAGIFWRESFAFG